MANVLIADDNEELADSWRRALESDGHTVTVVHDGEAAVETLKRQPFHVVITDVIMPRGGGLVVSGMARVHLGDAAVIAVSGYLADISGKARTDFLTNLGVRHILRKPVDVNELGRLVTALAVERAR